MTIELSK